MHLDTEDGFDFLTIEASNSSSGPWTDVSQGGWSGSTGSFFQTVPGGRRRLRRRRERLPALPPARATPASQGDGAHIDDIELMCVGSPSPTGDYQNLNGTSMATPHVAGAAALVLSRNPNLTPAQVRTLILSNVDPVAGLSGKVVTARPPEREQRRPRRGRHQAEHVDHRRPEEQDEEPHGDVQVQVAPRRAPRSSASSTAAPSRRAARGRPTANLKKGSHTFQVRATDKFGNLDTTPAKKTWKIVS